MSAGNEMDIVLTSNSPGEVAGWLTPAVAGLKQTWPQSRITVFLPPCDFASGSEKQVVERLPQVDQVYGPAQYLWYALTGRRPVGFTPGPRGFVLFLGGDLFHAVWLGHRLRYPVYAYTEGRARWQRVIRLWLVPNEASRQQVCGRYRVEPRRVRVVGWLPVDGVYQALRGTPGSTPPLAPGSAGAVGAGAASGGGASAGAASAGPQLGAAFPDWPPPRGSPGLPSCRLLLLPGSRPAPFRQLLGLFLGVAETLAAGWAHGPAVSGRWGELQVGLLLSPFISKGWLEQTLKEMAAEPGRASRTTPGQPGRRWLWRVNGSLRVSCLADGQPSGPPGVMGQLRLAGGLTVYVWQPATPVQRYRLMQRASLALAIPGTVTLEMAALGLPGLVVLPLQRPDLIPLPGLAGTLGRLPGLGGLIRRGVVAHLSGRTSYLAWPNRVTGRPYLPELQGRLGAEEIAAALRRILSQESPGWPRGRAALVQAVGGAGAAQRLAEAIAQDQAIQARPVGQVGQSR